MAQAPLTQAQIDEAVAALELAKGNQSEAARILGINRATFLNRIAKANSRQRRQGVNFHPAAECIKRGGGYTLAIFSDAHFWPDEFSPAFYIFCQILEHVQPEILIDLGDSFDGAGVSRHPPDGHYIPSVMDELDANREAKGLIANSAKGADKYAVPGNHGKRIANYVAANAPALGGMPGATLEDWFPSWNWADSIYLEDHTILLHDWKGGLHAGHNNALWSGLNTFTGHDHKLKVAPIDDMRGRRYGVHCGTLADIYGPQFRYTGGRPRDWASGFVLVEVEADRIHPEVVYVQPEGWAKWRGKVWRG